MANKLHIGKVELRSRVLVAPMSGVTDLPFRRVLQQFRPGMVVSEMVAGERLVKGDPENITRAPDKLYHKGIKLSAACGSGNIFRVALHQPLASHHFGDHHTRAKLLQYPPKGQVCHA